MRCGLTIAYGFTAVTPDATPKKKRTLLPLLTIVFVFSYGLMTLLIVEQSAAIESQSSLIKMLMRDSSEFWAAKGQAMAAKHAAQARAQAQAPSAKAPAAQVQDPAAQGQKHNPQAHTGKAVKPGFDVPPAPAADLVDHRRALNSI
jgi:hypothetical protein